MKYINKSIAEQTAFNMLKSIRDEVEQRENVFAQKCETIVIDSFDAETYKLVKKLTSEWVNKKSYFHITAGYGSVQISTKKDVRCPNNCYSINVSRELYEDVNKGVNELKLLRDKGNNIKCQIVETLLKLRTPDRIKKEFPEAFKYLPKDVMQLSTVAAIPVANILESIEKFPY